LIGIRITIRFWINISMKVVVIAPTMFVSERGTSQRILKQIESLLHKGVFITLYSYGLGGDHESLRHENLKIKRIPNFFPWLKSIPSGFSFYKIIADILLVIKVTFSLPKDTEVVHAHLYEGILIGWLVSKLYFCKKFVLVGDFHGSLSVEMGIKNVWLSSVVKKIESQIHTIPEIALASSVELCEYIEIIRKDEVLMIFDLPSVKSFFGCEVEKSEKILLYTGGFGIEKGIGILYKLMEKLSDLKNIHWVIAGSPIESLDIPKSIDSCRYTIVSPLSKKELESLLQKAYLGIDPKLNSLQGSGKILNYISSSVPVVAFFSKTNYFYIGDSSLDLTGLSIVELSDIIKGLVESTERRSKVARLVYERSKLFSINNLGDRLLSIYEKHI